MNVAVPLRSSGDLRRWVADRRRTAVRMNIMAILPGLIIAGLLTGVFKWEIFVPFIVLPTLAILTRAANRVEIEGPVLRASGFQQREHEVVLSDVDWSSSKLPAKWSIWSCGVVTAKNGDSVRFYGFDFATNDRVKIFEELIAARSAAIRGG